MYSLCEHLLQCTWKNLEQAPAGQEAEEKREVIHKQDKQKNQTKTHK